MSPQCVRAMGVRRALALFGDAKQATGEGKSGPVETGLTGPVATALVMIIMDVSHKNCKFCCPKSSEQHIDPGCCLILKHIPYSGKLSKGANFCDLPPQN